ncbi:hypothetical protein FACS1894196_1690 [Clostridia bacterium]|nr:hypothetical protein FACS1894196_1690 [Clostridia bacterium]
MFGILATDPKTLSKEEKARYRAFYCGLCRQLGARFGGVGSASLTYDMTFVAILLGALYGLEEDSGTRRCVPSPARRHPFVVTQATDYAADMNIILAYYQCMDDWSDERNIAARQKGLLLEKHLPAVKEAFPRQCAQIQRCLSRLGEMEEANELNPDVPTNCFGELMGSLFLWRGDEYSDALFRMGAALGRFIYLLDAVNDLKADIKGRRYNPLVAQMDTDFTQVLTLMMAECTAEFEKLPIHRDAHILQNILYAGVWQHYRPGKKEGAKP